ncbi:hypothetical protein ACEQPO_22770 [Bacillus sp. SL00103]
MAKDVSVESEDLLAFTEECHYGVTPVGVGILSQKDYLHQSSPTKATGRRSPLKQMETCSF